MKSLLFLTFFLLFNLNAAQLRIINGSEVDSSSPEWEFIVSLQFYDRHHCAGSLIHKEWVLTAAHCISDSNYPEILSGTYTLNMGGTTVEVDALYPHPQYDSGTVDNDIGLIHLKTPITDVTTIVLAKQMPEDESFIKVAGWGNISTDGSNYPDELMHVVMPVINFNTCNTSYGYLTGNMFCAGYMDGLKDSCQGDSGGPLIQNGMLSGIVSFGGSTTQACGAPDYPGVYTRVSNYRAWIENHTGVLRLKREVEMSYLPAVTNYLLY